MKNKIKVLIQDKLEENSLINCFKSVSEFNSFNFRILKHKAKLIFSTLIC